MSKFLENLYTAFSNQNFSDKDKQDMVKHFNKDIVAVNFGEFVQKLKESVNDELIIQKLNILCEAYQKKRRGETIKESFEEIESSLVALMKIMIDTKQFESLGPLYKQPFMKEVFDKYTTFSEGMDINTITIKESKQVYDFVYLKKWWKPRFKESAPVEDFIISISKGVNFSVDKDIHSLTESASMFMAISKDFIAKIGPDVEYIPPKTKSLNESTTPIWAKLLDSGKVSIRESETEIVFEFNGKFLDGSFKASREDKNKDFWNLSKIT